MVPAVSSLVKSNHPLVNASFSADKFQSYNEVEFFWSLFKAFPDSSRKLERTMAATKRLWTRKHEHILPPRKAFETTVDYYESFLPLFQAQQRFIKSFHVDNYFRSVQNALRTILPKQLF